MSAGAREGQTFAGESLLVRYVNLVKLPHTLFALPFALLGVLAASKVAAVTARTVGLVVIAFSAARWAAMGFNRIADLQFDARNPRTKNRELPRGALSTRQAWASVVVAGVLFVLASALLNPLCLALSPGGTGMGSDLQPFEALHLVAAFVARNEPRHRTGRRVPRRHGPMEPSSLAAAGGERGRRDLGRGIRHLLRTSRRRASIEITASEVPSSGSGKRRPFSSPRAFTP